MSDVDRMFELATTGEPNTGFSDERYHCITCSDEGCPLTVIAVDDERGLALCEDAAGVRSSVEIALVDRARAGAVLLVHAGTALAVLEPA